MSKGEAGSVAGLFAGIGGIEVGLARAAFAAEYFCEIDKRCQAVLTAKFPDVHLDADIQAVKKLPSVDVIAAGFPCQDLSVAGKRAGIEGLRSGLVDELIRLISNPRTAKFRWLLIENVPYMLGLNKGRAMAFLTAELEALGFTWASFSTTFVMRQSSPSARATMATASKPPGGGASLSNAFLTAVSVWLASGKNANPTAKRRDLALPCHSLFRSCQASAGT